MQVKAFRPRSIKTIEGHFRRYISALHYQGIDLSGITSLEEIVTKEMFQLAMRWFWDRNGGTNIQTHRRDWLGAFGVMPQST